MLLALMTSFASVPSPVRRALPWTEIRVGTRSLAGFTHIFAVHYGEKKVCSSLHAL